MLFSKFIAERSYIIDGIEQNVLDACKNAELEPLAQFIACFRAYIYWGISHRQEYVFRFLRSHYRVRFIADEALVLMTMGLIGRAVIDLESFGDLSLSEQVDRILDMCMGIVFSKSVL
ncbi:MAG: hypothetical protein ACRC2R_16165 [Xenococcaceae cyanobacterium]